MSEEERDSEQAPAGGVFGKLPDSRPGSRSPRRDSARSRGAAATTGKDTRAEKRRPATPLREVPRREPQRPPAPGPQQETPPDPELGQPATSLDDIAWAGVAAIAEAATFGVRLANRAFGAIRGGDDGDDDAGEANHLR